MRRLLTCRIWEVDVPDSGTRFGAAPLDTRKATWTSIRRHFSYAALGFMSSVLDAAIAAGANNIYSVDFSLPDPAALESEARADAVSRQN